jgi:spermidine synthase
VSDTSGAEPSRRLYNGSILHGVQLLANGRSRVPTAYYGLESGIGMALLALEPGKSRIGVIGLGAGTLAAYTGAGDLIRFYEINPEVAEVANSQFRFLRESAARVDVVLGDARLSLEREPPQNFDVLALDAFSSDSIPAHLLTWEAFQLYFRHLKPEGILAVHVTNKYLDLTPVVAGLAERLGKKVLLINSRGQPQREIYSARWLLVSSGNEAMAALARVSAPLPEKRVRVWTDDFSNLLQVLR